MKGVLLLTLLSFSILGYTQQFGENNTPEKPLISEYSFLERSYFGADLGFNVSNAFTYVNISPYFGYHLTHNLSVGPSLKYQFYNGQFQQGLNIYGIGGISRFDLGRLFFLQGEFEYINTENANAFAGFLGRRVWIETGLIGAGYKYGGGDDSFIQFIVLYDLIDDRNSPYRFQYYFGNIPIVIKGGFTYKF